MEGIKKRWNRDRWRGLRKDGIETDGGDYIRKDGMYSEGGDYKMMK